MTIPLYNPPPDIKFSIQHIVNLIIKERNTNIESDISKFEKEIDTIIYRIYNLSEEEVGIVESI